MDPSAYCRKVLAEDSIQVLTDEKDVIVAIWSELSSLVARPAPSVRRGIFFCLTSQRYPGHPFELVCWGDERNEVIGYSYPL